MPFDQQDCRQTIIDWIDDFNRFIADPPDHQNNGENLFLKTVFGVMPLG